MHSTDVQTNDFQMFLRLGTTTVVEGFVLLSLNFNILPGLSITL